ncbi:hypothetical protein FPV16_14905 [Methylobacterium sp. W2]|uniref:hypothetical protein n=1 Tax=Methylobacterium sp. W2 TaxID=2598107 RepID=UPI001D0C85A4|nr:hypothetical protein [Methylobacterium sp. W2]MCC0807503.1 hypothetical protein [Methylobacterium sp. W2]
MPAWPRSRTQVLDGSGRPYLDLRANFFAGGTTTPLVAYSNPGLTQAHQQPVVADANGRFPRVYLPDGLYAEQVLGTNGVELWYDDGLGVPAPVVDPVDPTPQPDATAFFQTGDTKWRPDGAILPGWVRMNGNRIGNASSGASERANADTLSLFTYLYNNFADDIVSVSGGRGTSGAAADFALGKTIAIPSMQGALAGGLDTMGSTAAGRIQTVRTINLTTGSATATVPDISRVAPGMYVYAPGVSGGTFVTDIIGNTVTLSAAAASGGSVTARFAVMNAERPGEIGGDSLSYLNNRNLPVAMPGGTTTYDDPPRTYKTHDTLHRIANGDGGTASPLDSMWSGEADVSSNLPPVTLGVTIVNPDGGRPFSNLPTMRLGTFYMKL